MMSSDGSALITLTLQLTFRAVFAFCNAYTMAGIIIDAGLSIDEFKNLLLGTNSHLLYNPHRLKILKIFHFI
jgi:hypothetical protein